jgi:phosphatidylinositol kinase/protein kinase (PI-3  family)
MEVCMGLLRENKDTLLSVLEPFLRDPTVAWGRQGRAQRPTESSSVKRGGGSEIAAFQDHENADAKVALEKINGRLNGVYNLCHPRGEDILYAYTRRKEIPPTRGMGASKEEALPLSVQGQVQRLIEEATALENLAQMYVGWQSWC